MAEQEKDKEFIEYIVKSIVDNPDDVKIKREVDEMGVLITLQVNAQDMGQVIGQAGSTAKSLRTLLRVIGAKNRARVNLKIDEPEGSERQDPKDKKAENVDDVVNDLKL
jgi:predicted RNA-binding protein YlqC (UPF0109 family)